jgi:hypothetical protein
VIVKKNAEIHRLYSQRVIAAHFSNSVHSDRNHKTPLNSKDGITFKTVKQRRDLHKRNLTSNKANESTKIFNGFPNVETDQFWEMNNM